MIFNPPTYTTSDDCYSIAYNFVGSFRTPIPTLTLMDVPLPKYPDPKSARSPCLYCTDTARVTVQNSKAPLSVSVSNKIELPIKKKSKFCGRLHKF